MVTNDDDESHDVRSFTSIRETVLEKKTPTYLITNDILRLFYLLSQG